MRKRKPAVAGQFYPARSDELSDMVHAYVDNSGVTPAGERVVALVVPHAGYPYSGPTAGHGYARVQGKHPKRVILMGCSHRYPIETASIVTEGAFDTPVGSFPIDEVFAKDLARKAKSHRSDAHALEHALEVQLPFLQAVMGEVPIVPVLLGSTPSAWHAELGAQLARMVDAEDLMVSSTDLSHYLDQERACAIDRRSIDVVLSKNLDAFARGLNDDSCSMCGGVAVYVTMAFAMALGAVAWSLLDYRTSAAVTGDYDRVVGYAAITMERPE
ncbi:MAG TPA: AmmeMemoRadiSam system protein B [Candidatus Hydrogenedentes bacterium]|nr:AmmeMemoRadiSam system protein B [Candidatus Hydrogenedentota bacterium]